jgi:hypothetical protein
LVPVFSAQAQPQPQPELALAGWRQAVWALLESALIRLPFSAALWAPGLKAQP